MMRLAPWIMALALLGLGREASAFRLRLHGLVTDYVTQGPMAKARIRIYKEGELVKVQTSNATGRYVYTFENHSNYVVRVDAPGYQGKCITIDTHGLEWEGDGKISDLEVEMRLLACRPGVDLSFLDLPLGLARFEPATGLTRWSRDYERNISADGRDLLQRYGRAVGQGTFLPSANRGPLPIPHPLIRL